MSRYAVHIGAALIGGLSKVSEMSRPFETPDEHTRLFELKDFVVEKFDAGNWIEIAIITDCRDLVPSDGRLLRSLHFGDEDYEGCALRALMMMQERHSDNLARIEAFIKKRFKIGYNISSGQSSSPTIVFQPKVFNIPATPVDPMLVSVMMPFNASMGPTYGAIKQAASKAGFHCQRADDIWECSAVIQDVFSLIFRSFIVICDFTGKNPNVFYEAGIAHTLGKHVIPITQSDGDIPFDLRHHRQLNYLANDEGRAVLTSELAKRLLTLDGQR